MGDVDPGFVDALPFVLSDETDLGVVSRATSAEQRAVALDTTEPDVAVVDVQPLSKRVLSSRSFQQLGGRTVAGCSLPADTARKAAERVGADLMPKADTTSSRTAIRVAGRRARAAGQPRLPEASS